MSTRLNEHTHDAIGEVIFEDNWYLLLMDCQDHFLTGITEPFKAVSRPHVSIIKNELPSLHIEDWGKKFIGDKVAIKFSEVLNNDNGLHYWVDGYSIGLCEIREHFGLPTLKKGETYLVNFHMTIGRRKKAVSPTLRDQLRISAHSHIDVETLMQHI